MMITRAITRICALSLLVLLGACDYSMMKNLPVSPGTGGNGSGRGNGSGDSSAITLAITPVSTVVTVGSQFRFITTVTGSTNQAVTWMMVSGPGSIDPNGYYSAPATITTDTVMAEVRATSQADSTVSATAKAFVVKAPGGGNGGGGGGSGSTVLCFERDVQPIFASNCAMRAGCHSTDRPQEGFIFSSYSGVRTGVVPGNPDASIIYWMITGKGKDGSRGGGDDGGHGGDDDIMPPPPNAPLNPAQIETIRRPVST